MAEYPRPLSPFAHEDAAGEVPGAVEPWDPVPAQPPAQWPFPSLSLHVENETARMEIRSPSRTEILNHHLLQPDVITESRQGACFDLPKRGRTGSQSYAKGVAGGARKTSWWGDRAHGSIPDAWHPRRSHQLLGTGL